MTKAYLIKINGAEVSEWTPEGVNDNERLFKGFEESKIINKDQLTRKDVLNAVCEMLYHTGEVTEEDLFDGNEDYFIFSRLENGEAEELKAASENGYYVQYFVDVELVENIKAEDII